MARAYNDVIKPDITLDPNLARFAEAAQEHFEAVHEAAFGVGQRFELRTWRSPFGSRGRAEVAD